MYLGVNYIQKWKVLLRQVSKETVEGLMAGLLTWAKEFKPPESFPSDVGFI